MQKRYMNKTKGFNTKIVGQNKVHVLLHSK